MLVIKILVTAIASLLFSVFLWAFSASYVQDVEIKSLQDILGFLRHGLLAPGLIPFATTLILIWSKPTEPPKFTRRILIIFFAMMFHYVVVAVSAHDDFYYYALQGFEFIVFGWVIWITNQNRFRSESVEGRS